MGRLLTAVAMVVLLGSIEAVGAQPPGGRFIDDDGNVHEGAIEAIASEGITTGCQPPVTDLFCPVAAVTRAEMAAFLVRALDLAPAQPSSRFADVAPSAWYAGFVERIAAEGIATGYPDGTYRPDSPLSRGEMAVLLVRALGEEASLQDPSGVFADVASAAFYASHVERLHALGVTRGCATDPLRYCPLGAVRRDEMASFVARAFGLPLSPPPPRTHPSAVSLRLTTVAAGLDQPLFLTAPAGDDRLFVVERPGTVRVLQGGTVLPEPFLDIRPLVSTGGERGLLGLAFAPDYSASGRLYVHYTDTAGDSRLVEYRVSGSDPNRADPATARVVLTVEQPASNHNGGMVAFGPDGYLYLALGDGGGAGDTYRNAQNPSTLLGAILRIDPLSATPYAIPAGNPFVGGGGAPEVWVYGLRNPWRFAFDGHRLYVADVGQGSWEEVNVLTTASGGANLGWPITEGASCFGSATCDTGGLTLPVHQYSHSEGCSITGGYVYRGSAVPELWGHYLYGDFCSGWVRSFRYTGTGVADGWDWSASLGSVDLLSSFGVDSAGEIYVTSLTGTVYRIERG